MENKYTIFNLELIDGNNYNEILNYDSYKDILDIKYTLNGFQLGMIDNYENKISILLSDLKQGTITTKNLEILISEIAEAFSF